MPKENDKISARLHKAIELAFELHGWDSRKRSKVPYLAHLLSVCAMVQMDGGDEEEAIAALLHDTLEDKADMIDGAEISCRFGERVLKIIRVSSDTPEDYKGGPKPPWKERKAAYHEHIRHTDKSLLRVTIADKVDNARAILADHQRIGEELWEHFNAGKEDQLWNYQESLQAYDSTGFSSPLLEELRRLVQELQKQEKPCQELRTKVWPPDWP